MIMALWLSRRLSGVVDIVNLKKLNNILAKPLFSDCVQEFLDCLHKIVELAITPNKKRSLPYFGSEIFETLPCWTNNVT